MINSVSSMYTLTHIPVLRQDLHPSGVTLISNIFAHLHIILALFFLLFPPFIQSPQTHGPYPSNSLLPHTFIWRTSYKELQHIGFLQPQVSHISRWVELDRQSRRDLLWQMNSSLLTGQSKTVYKKPPYGSGKKNQNTRKLKATKWTL